MRTAFRSELAVGHSLRWTNCARICSGLKWPWNIFLRRDAASRRCGGGIDFHHARRNHPGGKHAGSVSWAGVARRGCAGWSCPGRAFPGRATKRNRRAARCLRVLARQRVQHPLRAGFERNRGRSNFRPVAGWSLLPENSFFCKFLCKFASSFQALAFALQSIKPAVWRDVCSG
jgi:hypothetical protein